MRNRGGNGRDSVGLDPTSILGRRGISDPCWDRSARELLSCQPPVFSLGSSSLLDKGNVDLSPSSRPDIVR